MKRYVAIITVLSLCLSSFASCGSKEESKEKPKTSKEESEIIHENLTEDEGIEGTDEEINMDEYIDDIPEDNEPENLDKSNANSNNSRLSSERAKTLYNSWKNIISSVQNTTYIYNQLINLSNPENKIAKTLSEEASKNNISGYVYVQYLKINGKEIINYLYYADSMDSAEVGIYPNADIGFDYSYFSDIPELLGTAQTNTEELSKNSDILNQILSANSEIYYISGSRINKPYFVLSSDLEEIISDYRETNFIDCEIRTDLGESLGDFISKNYPDGEWAASDNDKYIFMYNSESYKKMWGDYFYVSPLDENGRFVSNVVYEDQDKINDYINCIETGQSEKSTDKKPIDLSNVKGYDPLSKKTVITPRKDVPDTGSKFLYDSYNGTEIFGEYCTDGWGRDWNDDMIDSRTLDYDTPITVKVDFTFTDETLKTIKELERKNITWLIALYPGAGFTAKYPTVFTKGKTCIYPDSDGSNSLIYIQNTKTTSLEFTIPAEEVNTLIAQNQFYNKGFKVSFANNIDYVNDLNEISYYGPASMQINKITIDQGNVFMTSTLIESGVNDYPIEPEYNDYV